MTSCQCFVRPAVQGLKNSCRGTPLKNNATKKKCLIGFTAFITDFSKYYYKYPLLKNYLPLRK
jgi:hypothetical protein